LRHSAIMALAANGSRLKKCTLPNLYNERPTWLKLAHETLAARCSPATPQHIPKAVGRRMGATVWAETGAGQPLATKDPLVPERATVDQAVLANLLRLNSVRAGR